MKKIKNLMIAFLSLISVVSFAQPGGRAPAGEKREQIESMKIAFLTRKLDLSSEEAQKFWPVYNQYQDEIDKNRDAHRKEMKDVRDEFDSLSDKDVEKIVDSELAFRQSELDIMKKYNGQFKSVIPIKKVAKLYRAEEDFKRELLKKIQERGSNGNQRMRK